MRRTILLKLLALTMALLMLRTPLVARASHDTGIVLDLFLKPNAHAKPMARMWFPDAAAGVDDNDCIEKQINELADKGFGGVEVAMLMSNGIYYTNEESRVYGWGTENWIKLLKKVLKAASKVPGGFQVDMTITGHWPPSLNSIDPNDDAASKELSFSVTPLTAGDLANGSIKLALPSQKTDGPVVTFGIRPYDHFLFTDTLVSATVAQIADVVTTPGENGAGDTVSYVFDLGSLQSITDGVEVIPGAGYAAGVPDRKTALSHGWDYDEICAFFGPESEGPWTQNNGKQDDGLNRRRMADWQDEYRASLEGVKIEPPEDANELGVGDWVVLSTFYRGTGQSISGGCIMHNGVFVTSYFNAEGTAAVTGCWDHMFQEDPELLALMRANPGCIFEDSIEATSVSSYWASTFMDDMDDGYAYRDILPAIAASRYVTSGFMGVTTTRFFSFTGDDGLADRIFEDYNDMLAELYVRYRVSGVAEWAKKALGWGFRGQTFHLPGLEIGKAAMAADVPECDNNAKGDGIRYQAGTANITGKDDLTMEAMTGPTIGYVNMDDVLTELGQNYSDGITRAVLHGTPYTRTFNGYNAEWPGWLPFGPGSYGSSYTYREAYWEDFDTETGFMSRVQAVLQNAEARIDLAVLIDKETTFDFESGNHFQELLDCGYSYNLVSESVLSHVNAVVSDGVLAADGPAYKAIIVDKVHVISPEGLRRLMEYAQAGLPIVLYDSDISRAYGSDVEADAGVIAAWASIADLENVYVASSLEEIPMALAALGMTSCARYQAPHLETTLYQDTVDGTNYYYLFNNAYPENSGMMGNSQGDNYKGEGKTLRNVTITLAGNGVPYQLDPYTGKVAQIGDYTVDDDGTVTFTIDSIFGGTAMIYAVTGNTEAFDAVAGEKIIRIVESDPIDLSSEKWNLVIHSYGPAEDSDDPGVSRITDMDFGAQPLGKWTDIQATEDQLHALGVSDMKYVSGTGEYALVFTTPDSWSAYSGAFITFEYGKDQIGGVIVNGTELPANNASDRVDVGTLIHEGRNELRVRLNSTLYGRTFVEHSGYQEAGAAYGMSPGFMAPSDPEAYYNGLLGVRIIPYGHH